MLYDQTEQMPTPVFIAGVAHRSGTNFLNSLLLQHPECTAANVKGEDFLISHAGLLQEYADRVAGDWEAEWGNDPAKLRRSIEWGLLHFLDPGIPGNKRLICKSPSAHDTRYFETVFSKGYLLLLIRDGRDLTESYIRSFNHRFEFAVRQWLKGVKEAGAALASQKERRIMLVRYEDLYNDTESQLRAIFSFIGADPANFDYEKARNTDVIGSSDLGRKRHGLHWNPVKKYEKFDPLSRSASWSRWRHYRFNYLAGEAMRKYGYTLKYPEKGIWYITYNLVASGYYFFHKLLFKSINAVKALHDGTGAAAKAFRKEF